MNFQPQSHIHARFYITKSADTNQSILFIQLQITTFRRQGKNVFIMPAIRIYTIHYSNSIFY